MDLEENQFFDLILTLSEKQLIYRISAKISQDFLAKITPGIGLLGENQSINLKWVILLLVAGGLFDMTDTVQEIAFRYAVDRVNSDRDVLPRSRLTAQIERIPQQDSFYASKQGSQLL